ncbi:MAG: prohibitin family protein [Cytophagaceae bacterium]
MFSKSKLVPIIFASAALMASCRTVKQDEVGVRRTFGKLNTNVLNAGLHTFNPFTSTILTLPIKTVNMEVTQDLPSKEGLLVHTDISILYHIKPDFAPNIITTIGNTNYEEVVIMSVFRSAAANITSRFYAKDMHTKERANIENAVKEQMDTLLEPRGFVIEAVLMKSIRLPQGLAQSIEQKLEAEQEAQRMEFVLQREKKEAERKKVEAEGIRDAQKIISEGLTPQIIEYKSIDAFKTLSSSPNSKVIITDGKTPLLITPKTEN